MKLNRIVPLCILAMFPVPNGCHRARDARRSAEAAAGGKAADGDTVRTESPRARAERRRDRRHPAHHSRWHLREAWEHHDRKRFRRTGRAIARVVSSAPTPPSMCGEGPRSRGTGQERHAFDFRILAEADFWPRVRPALRPSTGRLLWSRSGLASVRAGRLSAARSDVWRASGYARDPASRSVAASSTDGPPRQ